MIWGFPNHTATVREGRLSASVAPPNHLLVIRNRKLIRCLLAGYPNMKPSRLGASVPQPRRLIGLASCSDLVELFFERLKPRTEPTSTPLRPGKTTQRCKGIVEQRGLGIPIQRFIQIPIQRCIGIPIQRVIRKNISEIYCQCLQRSEKSCQFLPIPSACQQERF